MLSAFALALGVIPAYAADEASCQQMFEKADANRDGTVGGPEVVTFTEAYKAAGGQVSGSDAEIIITSP